jgi:hypothetical protein
VEVQLHSLLTSALDWVGGHRHDPGSYHRYKAPVSIVEAAWWTPGPLWTDMENILPHTEFEPRIVQAVASRYTDCVILAPI